MNKKQIQQLIEATGALAEMTVLFFKAAIHAGASVSEAQMFTQMFLEGFFKRPDQASLKGEDDAED